MMSGNNEPPVTAVAIAHFVEPFPELPSTSSTQFLPLLVGERVKIISHCNDWCFGQYETNPGVVGMFPSSFIQVIEDSVMDEEMIRRRSSTSFFVWDEEAKILMAEIVEAIKAWWRYMNAEDLSAENMKKYWLHMKEMMLLRKKILSGRIPTEELRELRHECARKIDLGNHWMGLGMHIRDEASRILRIDKLSVVEAYRLHEKAFSKVTSNEPLKAATTTAVIVDVSQMDFKLKFDCELTLIIWHSGTRKAVSEPLTLKWDKKTKKFKHKSMNAMFIGLSENELMDDRLELAAAITVLAPIDISLLAAAGKYVRVEDLRNADCKKQPLAEARMSLAEKLRDIANKEKRELRLSMKPMIPVEKFQTFELKRGDLAIEFVVQKLNGNNLDDIKQRYPEVFGSNPPVPIRRLIPENAKGIIEEMRNEVFVKLGASDLHGGKHADKNIEAVLNVYDDEGTPQMNCFEIMTPDGIERTDEHRTRIFCMEDKPSFDELVKVVLPEKSCRDLHLRILFYNRRTVDKNVKGPFAMSYLRIFNKSVLEKSNFGDELLVYKIEKFEKGNVSYLRQYSTKSEQKSNLKPQLKPEGSSFVLNDKNYLGFEMTILSCIHTTDTRLMHILKFKDKQADVPAKINSLISSDDATEDLIIFLHPFLDALFQILNCNDKVVRDVIFQAIIHVIRICEDEYYQSILDDYMELFYAAHAFDPLCQALIDYIDEAPRKTDMTRDPLLPVLRALKYVTKMIIKSKECHDLIQPRSELNLIENLWKVLKKLKELVQDDMKRMICQNAAIKYLPSTLQAMLTSNTFESVILAEYVLDLFSGLSKNVITRQRISFLKDIVGTDLFKDPECVNILLPVFLEELTNQMDPQWTTGQRRSDFGSDDYLKTVQLCSEVLSDILEILFPFSHFKSVFQRGLTEQLELIVLETFKTVNRTVVALLSREPSEVRPVQALLLALLDKFSTKIFLDLFSDLGSDLDRLDLLTEILRMFRSLTDNCSFPNEWYQMRYIQHKCFMKHVRFIKAYILKFFYDESFYEIWLEFFKTTCAIVKRIVPSEHTSVFNQENKSMRENAALTIRSMWLSLLPEHKTLIVDKILENLIEVLLIDDKEIRIGLIPVIYDMLMLERNESSRFVDEFIMCLDPFIDLGLGNNDFREQLRTELTRICAKDDYVQLEFVERIDSLLELLLNLRDVYNNGDCLDSGRLCLVQLIDFYDSIQLNELKVHHLLNLHNTHLNSGNHVEAAFALKRIVDLLEWNDDPIPPFILKRITNKNCRNQSLLREHYLLEMANLFEIGEHWEKAIDVLEELIPIYKQTKQQMKLADLLSRTAKLYQKINKTVRVESNYFLVGFFGNLFPEYLRNKKFVFRGEKLEYMLQFKEKMLNSFFGAQSVENMDDCDHLMNSDGKFIQIIPVNAIKMSRKPRDENDTVMTTWYSKHHDVCQFEMLRPERRDNTKWTKIDANDATRLWIRKKIITTANKLPGVLNFSIVESEMELEPLNPVQVAIHQLEQTNDNLRNSAELVLRGFDQFVVGLGGGIRGVLQADVGGGIRNYESFFSEEIMSEATPAEIKSIARLRKVLIGHVTVIESCLAVHASKFSSSASQQNLEVLKQNFDVLKQNLEASKIIVDASKQNLESSKQNFDAIKQNLDALMQNLETTKQMLETSKQNLDSSKLNLVNEKFHSALVDLFQDYRRNIETKFGTAPSMLSEGASIHLPFSGNLSATTFTSNQSFNQGSTSSLSLDDSTEKQNVIFRGIAGLRTTMSRTKVGVTPPRKPTSNGVEAEHNREQMLKNLQRMACRSIVTSPEPRDVRQDFENALGKTREMTPPPLPPRIHNTSDKLINSHWQN